MIKKVWAVSFSPVGGTKKVTDHIARCAAKALGAEIGYIDFTHPSDRQRELAFSGEELAVVGMSVYAGRIPNKIMPDVKRCFAGNGACAAAICTYGNRSFGGTVTELQSILQENGFRVMGAAAFVCQHVFSEKVGAGRPNEADISEMEQFGCALAEKIKSGGQPLPPAGEIAPYYTPLREDGLPAKFLKSKPVTDTDVCVGCGLCARVCPMGSIDAAQPSLVSGVCIKCQACIQNCPVHAKRLEDADFLSHVRMLEKNFTEPNRNEIFLR